MIRLAAQLNKLVRIAKFIYARTGQAFENFFDLQQRRLESIPIERRPEYAQQLMSEPLFSQFLERKIKSYLDQTYSTYEPRVREDAFDGVYNLMIDNLPQVLSKYSANTGVPLMGWISSTIKMYAMREIDRAQKHQRAFSNNDIFNWNDMQSNAGGIPNIPGDEWGNFHNKMSTNDPIWGMYEQLEQVYNQINALKSKPLPTIRDKEALSILMNWSKDMESRIHNYTHDSRDQTRSATPEEQLEVQDLSRENISEQSRKNIPLSELAEIMDRMTMRGKNYARRNNISENGNYPASSFFHQETLHQDESTRSLMSKLLMESMMEAQRHFSLMNSKDALFSNDKRQKIQNQNFKPLVIQYMIQKMSERHISPEIQKRVIEHIEYTNDREMVNKPQELDEMMRIAYYNWAKNNFFPGKNWAQLTNEQKQFIVNDTHARMEYDRGGVMHVRKFDNNPQVSQAKFPGGIDRVPRRTRNLTTEMRNQLMMQELSNLSQGKSGFELGANLPINSPYFNVLKRKPDGFEQHQESQEMVYAPVNTNGAYIQASRNQLQMIRTALNNLITYAEWCDKNELYGQSESTYSTIKVASTIINPI